MYKVLRNLLYQSHHQGIETRLLFHPRSSDESTNRTIKELKREVTMNITGVSIATNRTIKELKPLCHIQMQCLHLATNRTIKELKHIK